MAEPTPTQTLVEGADAQTEEGAGEHVSEYGSARLRLRARRPVVTGSARHRPPQGGDRWVRITPGTGQRRINERPLGFFPNKVTRLISSRS